MGQRPLFTVPMLFWYAVIIQRNGVAGTLAVGGSFELLVLALVSDGVRITGDSRFTVQGPHSPAYELCTVIPDAIRNRMSM